VSVEGENLVPKRALSGTLTAVLLSVAALLSWWRASKGMAGWTEIAVVLSIGAVVSWVLYMRARRKQAS
jgi:hypothetical protein